MIQLLMGIAALLLLFVSYYLLKKQPIFFVLIEKTEKNQGFIALSYLILVILVASVFSINFAKKMAKPNSK